MRYGDAEPWKAISEEFGTTHKERLPHHLADVLSKTWVSDGVPPSTAKAMRHAAVSTSQRSTPRPSRDVDHMQLFSRSNKNNSCWLDVSLELIERSLEGRLGTLTAIFPTHPDWILWNLREVLMGRTRLLESTLFK